MFHLTSEERKEKKKKKKGEKKKETLEKEKALEERILGRSWYSKLDQGHALRLVHQRTRGRGLKRKRQR